MAEKKEYKCDPDQTGCPRVRLLQRLQAAGNTRLIAALVKRPYTPTAQDLERSRQFANSHGTEEKPLRVIPTTCDFWRNCIDVTNNIDQQFTAEQMAATARRAPGMPGMPGMPPIR